MYLSTQDHSPNRTDCRFAHHNSMLGALVLSVQMSGSEWRRTGIARNLKWDEAEPFRCFHLSVRPVEAQRAIEAFLQHRIYRVTIVL